VSELTPPWRIVLGSSSPRRKDLLETLGFTFTIIKPDVEERILFGESPEQYALRNATQKASWVIQREKDYPVMVISCDTIVVKDGRVLEKPADVRDAVRMITMLQGSSHEVVSGIALAWHDGKMPNNISRTVTTRVTFKTMSEAEIEAYVARGESLDKAGGYAAQGNGGYLISSVQGSFTNVIGLPMSELVGMMEAAAGRSLWSH